jgi:hypothetical protein
MAPSTVENEMVNYEAMALWAVEMTIIKMSMEAIK